VRPLGFRSEFLWPTDRLGIETILVAPVISSDEGSGLASTTLVSSSSALADCSRGTLLYAGPDCSFKAAKLPTGITHFRVCASDAAGNVSSGVPTSVKVTGSWLWETARSRAVSPLFLTG
jgi:hypothetical protein